MIQNGHVHVICCRREVADDVISGENEKTVEGCGALNFEVASFSGFCGIPKNQFMTAEAVAEIDDSIKRKQIRVSL